MKGYVMPVYGQFIWATEQYVRSKSDGDARYWSTRKIDGHGIYLGTCTLQNGQMVARKKHRYFKPLATFSAVLFSPGPNQKPIYVPVDAIKI